MKFYLVDRIEQIEPGRRIVCTKNLTAAEEYLADHFPTFPVMPGVMMLEACVQSAAWLVRIMTDWKVSLVVLQTARNIRYASFVAPGDTLRIEAELSRLDLEAALAVFNCTGTVGGEKCVQAKIELRLLNLADTQGYLAAADRQIVEQMKLRFRLCGGEERLAASAAAR